MNICVLQIIQSVKGNLASFFIVIQKVFISVDDIVKKPYYLDIFNLPCISYWLVVSTAAGADASTCKFQDQYPYLSFKSN